MIVFDEKKYAERMLTRGYLTKHKHVYELNILSKYYYSEGKSEDEVKDCIILFCKMHDEHFNIDEWYKIINKTTSIAKKSRLVTGVDVCITENELKYISKLNKLNEQKVAFVLLVLYKFYNYKRFEVSIEDLYRLCKLKLNSKQKLEILQSLTSADMIDITMGGKRWVKFAEKRGNLVINIRNFDDFIYEYHKYIGDNIIYCENEECKKPVKATGKNQRMCKECFKESRKNYQKELMRKIRSSNTKC